MIIERWFSRFHTQQPLSQAAVAAWHHQLDAIDEAALLDGLLGDDEWLLFDRLPLTLRWNPALATSRFELQNALRRALETHRGDRRVVYYASRREAWSDLFYRAALNDLERVWAWARMGLAPAGLARTTDAQVVLSEAAVTVAEEPGMPWIVVLRLLDSGTGTAAFAALLGTLATAPWLALMRTVPQVEPYLGVSVADRLAVAVPPIPVSHWPRDRAVDRKRLDALLVWIERHPWLARQHAQKVAPILAALTWPPSGTTDSGQLRQQLQQAQNLCTQAVSVVQPTTRRAAAQTGALLPDTEIDPVDVSEDRALPALADLPAVGEECRTAWAGALFWLGKLGQSGVLDQLPEVADAPDIARAQFLHALADSLGVAAEDPVRRVLMGDIRIERVPPLCLERARTLCAGWEAWLDASAPDLPAPRLHWICRRPGLLRFEPGWVELVLPLESVETTIRRLGLDLDPGWLPWLGCVLRIRYE